MRIFEWLGGLMMIVALVEFIPNPKKAIQSITSVLATNVRMEGNHLAMPSPNPKERGVKIK